MARRLRVEFSGAYYDVMARRILREAAFLHDDDRWIRRNFPCIRGGLRLPCLMRWAMPLILTMLAATAGEESFLDRVRQLTFEGRRAGEGYFSADGRAMVFQSERDQANPFFQIFLLDLETGDTRRISPGTGKTTCAWIHPREKKVLFASTHEDPQSKSLQERELAERTQGKMRRYSWDYDEHFEIHEAGFDGSGSRNLTRTRGYDAEGACSPDGSRIVFASNRAAYIAPLDEADRKRLEVDKQFFIDIYTMAADGSDVRRLTDSPGYDGGPFFSADGKRICWRRFNETGDKAEVWTMNADGSNQQQVTRLDALSWAPFFHPSGDYLIFSTNRHGFDNFELYIVDAAGRRDPVRVTHIDGFDSLASFSPDGKMLTWTSNRTADRTSQIFLAAWNDQHARQSLCLDAPGPPAAAPPDPRSFDTAISPVDLKRHVEFLSSEALDGRMTGTPGELAATQYVADVFGALGLQPAGASGTWFLPFDFTAGVEPGPRNALTTGGDPLTSGRDWNPVSFSDIGDVPSSEAVFAGYGIEMPAENGAGDEYSSYAHLDPAGKWVIVLRYLPEGATGDLRTRLTRHTSLRRKALTARQRGARGIIFVSGPNSKVREQLVPLSFDASLSGSGLAAISVTDAVASKWLAAAGRDLKQLQDELDKPLPVQGFPIPDLKIAATIDLKQEKRAGRNVIARLPAPAAPVAAHSARAGDSAASEPPLLIGAHVDHLGREAGGNSRATEAERGRFHPGADDNASGVAAVLEIAQFLTRADQPLTRKRDILFAAWSGEEIGLLGSSAFATMLGKSTGDDSLGDDLCAVLNMDMIGRLGKTLVLQGLASSDVWKPLIEKRNVPIGLPLTLQNDCFAPTDTTTFYPKRVPILNAFTGSHDDYHRPTDTPDKINYEGAAQVARLMAAIADDLATTDAEPVWIESKSSERQGQRSAMRVYLGTIPDYSQGDIEGVRLSGVSPVGPAAKAGLRGGDVIVALGGRDIKNIYDYTFILGELKIDAETDVTVLRDKTKLILKITPVSRD